MDGENLSNLDGILKDSYPSKKKGFQKAMPMKKPKKQEKKNGKA
jgi:hypothetical protein